MSTRRRPSPTSPLPRVLIALLVVAGLGILFYGIANSMGLFANQPTGPVKPSREGRVPIPRTLVALKAFEKVKREDVYDREQGDESFFWLPKEAVEQNPDWVTSIDQIVNRVMARDKGADFVFKKSDFLPVGSRTGLMAGVPQGKQGFFLDAEKIPGMRFLKQGDRFDLLASLPKESEDASTEYGLLMGGIKARGNKPIPINGIRLLVKGGQMIALTTNRSMTTQGGLELQTTDSNGREIRNQKSERVAIAIDPEEAVPLTQALGDDLEIHMVAQSGQFNEQESDENALEGLIPFPANAIEIEAFSTIKASDLAEPLSGDLRRYYFKPGDALDTWIPNVNDLIGKVVARDIEPGYIFSESDFLPPGSLIKSVKSFQTLSRSDLVASQGNAIVGGVVARDMEAGEVVTQDDLLDPGTLIQTIEAYQKIAASDLVQGNTSKWVGQHVTRRLDPGHLVQEQDLLDTDSTLEGIEPFQRITASHLAGGANSKMVGRIAARKIDAGQNVTDALLLPEGSRPGISGGIPNGKMAISVDAKSIKGMKDLSMGDRVDLVETSVVDLKSSLSGIALSKSLLASAGQQAFNQVLASDAVVVQKLDEQVVLAVGSGEVSGLVKSLAQQKEIVAISRPDSSPPLVDQSTETDVNSNRIESDTHPLKNIVVTELIVNGEKSAQAYRRTNDE